MCRTSKLKEGRVLAKAARKKRRHHKLMVALNSTSTKPTMCKSLQGKYSTAKTMLRTRTFDLKMGRTTVMRTSSRMKGVQRGVGRNGVQTRGNSHRMRATVPADHSLQNLT